VLVGGDFSKIKHPYLYLPDSHAAKAWFESRNFHDMTILVKGSRAIAMEKVIQ
jgi:UDP-N-acetylmuramoyl-tripeptide--D-alanyl-D-alanine ligase